jgi:N-acetylglucosaminyl-diphospho-decaprenol L-rhamnosyltransferase
MRFSLICLTYQSAAFIHEALTSFRAAISELGGNNAELILADNGSDDANYQSIAESFGAHFIQNGQNLGYAEGNNRAATEAKGDYLIFLNPDLVLAKCALKALSEALDQYTDYQLMTGWSINHSDHKRLDGAGDAMSLWGIPYRMGNNLKTPNHTYDAEVFAPSGSFLVIKKSLFSQLKGFYSPYFCYCEDVDLGFRARLLGHKALLVGKAWAFHHGSATLGRRSDFAVYHGYRNRFWLVMRCFPSFLLPIILGPHLGLVGILWLRDWLSGRGKPATKGLIDGIRGLRGILRSRKDIVRPSSPKTLLRALTWSFSHLGNRAMDHRSP